MSRQYHSLPGIKYNLKSAQIKKFNESVNWIVEETFLNLYMIDMAAFEQSWLNKVVTFKKGLILHSFEVSSSPNLPLLSVIVF